MNGALPNAYLCSNIISIPEKLLNTASLIKWKSGYSLFVVHSTHYINKGITCQRNNDADYVGEEILYSLSRQVKTYLIS
jgi:hypothetical protein